mmetsp:Transcript_6733/g.29662  ORF Transcript_6733/g.29662 Transcript_6733/m.29662 type:complete len:275 (-) Transcript_6733:682-1506(-)
MVQGGPRGTARGTDAGQPRQAHHAPSDAGRPGRQGAGSAGARDGNDSRPRRGGGARPVQRDGRGGGAGRRRPGLDGWANSRSAADPRADAVRQLRRSQARAQARDVADCGRGATGGLHRGVDGRFLRRRRRDDDTAVVRAADDGGFLRGAGRGGDGDVPHAGRERGAERGGRGRGGDGQRAARRPREGRSGREADRRRPGVRVPHPAGAAAGRGEDVRGRARAGARGALGGAVLPPVRARLRLREVERGGGSCRSATRIAGESVVYRYFRTRKL